MKTKGHVTVKKKKYEYSLSAKEKGVFNFACKAANINQEFLPEDIPQLLVDLPQLIITEQNYQDRQKSLIQFRLTGKEKKQIEEKAFAKGYSSVSQYLRDVALS